MSNTREQWAYLETVLEATPVDELNPNGGQLKMKAELPVFSTKGPVWGDVYRDRDTGQRVAIAWDARMLTWTKKPEDPLATEPLLHNKWEPFPPQPQPGTYPWRAE
jgi:hypothetical protein